MTVIQSSVPLLSSRIPASEKDSNTAGIPGQHHSLEFTKGRQGGWRCSFPGFVKDLKCCFQENHDGTWRLVPVIYLNTIRTATKNNADDNNGDNTNNDDNDNKEEQERNKHQEQQNKTKANCQIQQKHKEKLNSTSGKPINRPPTRPKQKQTKCLLFQLPNQPTNQPFHPPLPAPFTTLGRAFQGTLFVWRCRRHRRRSWWPRAHSGRGCRRGPPAPGQRPAAGCSKRGGFRKKTNSQKILCVFCWLNRSQKICAWRMGNMYFRYIDVELLFDVLWEKNTQTCLVSFCTLRQSWCL